MNVFNYPFPSALASQTGEEIDVWVKPGINLESTLRSVEGPIVELAGPTDLGYYFLDGIALPSKPIITNIQPKTLLYGPGTDYVLDKIIDGRHTPYKDSSVGMVLSAHLPYINEAAFDFSNKFTHQQEKEYAQLVKEAQLLTKDFADGANIAELPLRLAIAKESFRILHPGGLYLCDGSQHDRKGMLRLGFQELAFVRLKTEPYYYMVLQKPQS